MNFSLFLRSLLMGLSIAAPVGPIGILCMRRSLMEGRLIGLITGLGAASADGVYGCIAGLGITLVSGFLIAQSNWIRLAGGLFLAYLGISALLARPPEQISAVRQVSPLGAFISTFLLTLSNPIPILSFAAIFTGLGAGLNTSDFKSVITVVLGIFSGSASWWLLLSSSVSLAHTKITPRILLWVNRISGLAILGFAGAVLAGIRL
ncbi:MAG: LysE family transporter [Anaerolineaceae bacterium]|nr:LysE family transporter [Anaerolineaceae bacterium]